MLVPDPIQALADSKRADSSLSSKRTATSSFMAPVSFPGERGSDSIALSTAKATVWNRGLKDQQQAAVVAEQQAASNRRQLSMDLLTRPSPSIPASVTWASLPVPPQKQPHLAIRRVLQVGYEVSLTFVGDEFCFVRYSQNAERSDRR